MAHFSVLRLSTRTRFRLALLCLSACFIAACSGPQSRRQEFGRFTQLERDGGLRLFEYEFRRPQQQVRPITHTTDPERLAREREMLKPENQLHHAKLLLKRDSRVKEYCPNGYIILDEYVVLDEIKIRGECRYQESTSR
ncbi:MAG: hypothetical protein R3221_05800 [Spongiibacter sp.]|nr:hypothetical protein [Spongiibacter sp.]